MNYRKFKVLCDNPNNSELALLARQFNSLLLSLSFARKLDRNSVFIEDQEIIRQRELLAVEQRRQDERDRMYHSRQQQRARMSEALHEQVFTALLQVMETPEELRNRGLLMSGHSVSFLDQLHARAASMRGLETHAASLSWLEDDLLRIVNMPPFANLADPKRVRVTTLRNALGFIGVDDLRYLIPAYTMQYWLPKAIEPFNLLAQKLWEHSFATAITAKTLAELDGQSNPALAFTVAMFHDLGKGVLARLYASLFIEIQRQQLDKYRLKNESSSYNTLVELEPSELFLRNLFVHFSAMFTEKLFANVKFQFVPFHAVYADLVATETAQERTGLTRILYQAQAYTKFRTLHQAGFATATEAKLLYKDAELSLAVIEKLHTTNLKVLNVLRGPVNELIPST